MQTEYATFPLPTQTKLKRGRKPPPPEPDGERPKATEFFNGLAEVVRNKLLPTTVLLRSLVGLASGVILGVDEGNAYVLTAKHNLFTLAGQTTPDKEPREYYPDAYAEGIKIRYGPTALLGSPLNPIEPSVARVSNVNFAGIDGNCNSWIYDAILLESSDADFIAFVKENRFIDNNNCTQHQTLLQLRKGKYPLLSRRNYKHIQLGYGKGRAVDVSIDLTGNYTDHEGKLQCKASIPVAETTSPVTLYEPNKKVKDRTKWRSMTQAIELSANITNSTAPGDSGGPLFAINNKEPGIFLLGVTSGANWYGDEERLNSPPSEREIHNNVVTYWDEMFAYCENTFLRTE